MRVLVTGGAGYLGSRVVARLLARGHSVRVLDNMTYGGEAALALSGLDLSVKVGDIRDPLSVAEALQGVDAVVHLAAIVGEPACNVDPALSHAINVEAVTALLDAVREAEVPRLLVISTCSNYGVTNPDVIVDETAALNPLSDYARAKVLAEHAALADSTKGVVTVLRFATICGLAPRMRFDLLVNEMARDAVLGREIQIYTPQAWRPYLHIDDAAEAIETVLTAPAELVDRQVFNVVGENHQKTSLLEIARRYDPALKYTIVDRQPDLRDYRVSGDRIRQALGFVPARTVEQAFREVAEAVRARFIRDPDWAGHSATPLDGFKSLQPSNS